MRYVALNKWAGLSLSPINPKMRQPLILRNDMCLQALSLLAGLGVFDLVALAAGRRVPAGNVGATTNVGEARNVGLLRPAVAVDEAIGTVRAGDGGQRTAAIGVAGVV